MRTRIGVQIAVAVALVTALSIGLVATIALTAQRRELIAQLTGSADLLSETVRNTTRDSMLENHREKLRQQIEAIGRQERIDRVRVFNKEGRVAFSSDPAEVGRILDTRAESCYACHAQDRPLEQPTVQERARIFRNAAGTRVLGIVNPIRNEPSCSAASCHAHGAGDRVLGVLDVTLSLADADRRIATTRDRIVVVAAAIIVLTGLLLFWLSRRLIIRPVAALTLGTRRVAGGDLTTAIPVTGGRELGELARAFNDMTARLADSQRALTQADKLASVGRLAAGVAHEINNPLTGVLTYASFLLQRAQDSPEQRQDLEVIVRETRRCREIVRGLLDFARQTPPRRQPTDLNEVARRAVAVVMHQLQLRHVALDLDLADDLPVVPADGNQIQQVMVNLLLNAADAIGDQGGAIRLASRRVDAPPVAVQLVVEDDGCGIPREALPRLFEPFFSTKGVRGTGLGLAITWGIVEGHGGTIEVESEVGKGTRFTLRLPRAAAEDARNAAAA